MTDSASKRVFISYSHESEVHAELVLRLSNRLRLDGVDCRIDAFKKPGEPWHSWMERQIARADVVLCVITEQYNLRFSNQVAEEVGKGVHWEANLIRNQLYDAKGINRKYIPVAFTRDDLQFIPDALKSYDRFQLSDNASYKRLLHRIFNRPQFIEPDVGTTPHLESRVIMSPSPLTDT